MVLLNEDFLINFLIHKSFGFGFLLKLLITICRPSAVQLLFLKQSITTFGALCKNPS